ncbi:DYF13 [Symbiodinium microadriaticum]|nr:DYF13 [Symbiodinium microadriaticum]
MIYELQQSKMSSMRSHKLQVSASNFAPEDGPLIIKTGGPMDIKIPRCAEKLTLKEATGVTDGRHRDIKIPLLWVMGAFLKVSVRQEPGIREWIPLKDEGHFADEAEAEATPGLHCAMSMLPTHPLVRKDRRKLYFEGLDIDILPSLEEFLEVCDYVGAVTLLEFEKKTREDRPHLLMWLAYSYFHNGDYKKAIDTYDDAMRKENDPNIAVYKACCHYALCQYQEAEEEATKAQFRVEAQGSPSEYLII